VLLVAILALGAFFRFNGREFDKGTFQHPDEITVSGRLARVHWPGPGENLFDPLSSPMNLRALGTDTSCVENGCEYPYGALPIYLTKAAGWLVDSLIAPDDAKKGFYVNDGWGLTIMGRHLSSIFDLITVLLVFLIARRLYSSSAGLIAAALVAFSATHIQLAHFTTVDSFLTTFMIAALYFSVVLMQRPSWWAAAAAGACIGFAVATKVSVVPFALVVVAAVVLRALYRRQTRKLGAEFGAPIGLKPASAAERSRSFWGHLGRNLIYLPVAFVASLLAFSLAEPYVLWQFSYSLFSQKDGLQKVLDSNPWWTRIVKESRIQSGQDDIVYTRQYVGTVPILYHLQNMVFWGLSPIPGFLTIAGFVVGLWKAIRRRPAEILLMAGALPYFASLLTLEAKWMRYMLPLVPVFCILGAALVVRGHVWVQRRVGSARKVTRPGTPGRALFLPRLQRNVFALVGVASVLGAFLWAVAFSNIYSQKHSRLAASDWIRVNVPPGIVRTSEAWDRGLPNDGNDCPGCQNVELDIYGDQPPDVKFDYFKEQLAKVDYIFIASNRLYGSIARMPWRYPVHILFYDLLYAGKLGYQRVHTALVTPEIFGIRFDDQSADESFTVYDHPRVDIFQKTSNLTDDQLQTLFQPALNRPVADFQTVRHGKVSDDKPLTYSQPVSSLPDVGDFAWNPLAQEDTQWIAVLLWLLAAQLLGFIALPIVFSVCRNLPDRGYAFAKLLGLLLVSWGSWIAASTRLIPFTAWSVLLMVAIMGALAALCWRLGAGKEIREFFVRKRSLVIFYEVLFFTAFAAFLVIRILNPDLWHPTNGGEKPMEIGFLNSVLRSPWMPPLDPFFSGGYINYYYHGYVILASLIKLVGVDPAIAVNLTIPLFYALTFTAGASLVYNIVAWSQRRRGSLHEVSRAGMAFGVLAGVLMLVIGNMNGLWQYIMVNSSEATRNGMSTWARNAGFTLDSMVRPYAGYNFWDPSRIIPGTINEFPFWSFLFADLHPHLINMPFTIFAAGLGLNLAFAGALRRSVLAHIPRVDANLFKRLIARVRNALAWLWGDGWSGALRFAVMALTLGGLIVINSWDFPTYLGVAFGSVLVALFCARRADVAVADTNADLQLSGEQSSAAREAEGEDARADAWTRVVASLLSLGVLAGVALLAYIPFFLSFKAFYTQILFNVDGGMLPTGGIIMRRTTLGEFLVMWLIFLFIAGSYLVYRLAEFPWGQAFAGLRDLALNRPPARSTSPAPQQAFRRVEGENSRAARRFFPRPRSLTLAAASPSGGGQSPIPASYAFRTDVGETTPEPTPVDSPDGPLLEIEPQEGQLLIVDGIDGRDGTPDLDTPEESARWMSHSTNGNLSVEIVEDAEPQVSTNWMVEAYREASPQEAAPVRVPRVPTEGAIPAWAGLLMLVLTGALVILQIATKQYLLGLLIMMLGGILAATLVGRRSAGSYFTSLLLVGALAVALGVEVIYLADHLHFSDVYRMNTVFKFYIQVWVLFALGGAAAIYYILFGLREHVRRRAEVVIADMPHAETPVAAIPAEVMESPTVPSEAEDNPPVYMPPARNITTTDNWLVWAVTEPLTAESLEPAVAEVVPSSAPVIVEQQAVLEEEATEDAWPRWTLGKLAWSGVFVLLLFASFVYTLFGTPVRLADRFDAQPPIGTLNGQKYMTTAVLNNAQAAPFPMQLKYDYEAIRWMNQNIRGNHVIAERPIGYYREFGMRAASNTGFPMVVGSQHQGEQRYDWQVGPRAGDMDEFFRTADVQRALILMSKYDIDYIYLGQLEVGYAPQGVAKFKQMADPKVGILREVFRTPDDPEVPGTTIYEVIRDVDTITGSPVKGSGIPGVSLTPIPTAVPTPAPTPPTDDPELKTLLDASRANPLDAEKRMSLANWYKAHGFHEYAAKELEALSKQNPPDVALRHMWGDELREAGKLDEALAAWASAVEVAPNDPAAHNKLGIAYLDRRQFDKAKEAFEAVVRIDQGWTEGWFHLGETYERMGKRDDAKNAYQSLIDKARNPEDDWVKSARRKIEELR
jgi:YYY domain-containing protein